MKNIMKHITTKNLYKTGGQQQCLMCVIPKEWIKAAQYNIGEFRYVQMIYEDHKKLTIKPYSGNKQSDIKTGTIQRSGLNQYSNYLIIPRSWLHLNKKTFDSVIIEYNGPECLTIKPNY